MEDNLAKTLEVRKDNWAQTRVTCSPLETDLADNEVLFRIDRMALTSNNISYASSGDASGLLGVFSCGRRLGQNSRYGLG